MLALLAASSMLGGRGWWEVPNLLGSTFYHGRAFYWGVGRATVAGGALQLTVSGSIGALFGAVCGHVPSRHRLILLGTLTGVSWFFLGNLLVWPRLNPLIPLYSPEPAAVLSHVLFGACLGYAATIDPVSSGPSGPPDAVES